MDIRNDVHFREYKRDPRHDLRVAIKSFECLVITRLVTAEDLVESSEEVLGTVQ